MSFAHVLESLYGTLLALKIVGLIDMSWWILLIPLFITAIFAIIAFIIVILID